MNWHKIIFQLALTVVVGLILGDIIATYVMDLEIALLAFQ